MSDEAPLTTVLRDPQGVVKRHRYSCIGRRDDEEINTVLAYLATFAPYGIAPSWVRGKNSNPGTSRSGSTSCFWLAVAGLRT